MLKTVLAFGLTGVGLVTMLLALTQVIAANLDYASARYRMINMLRSAPNNAEVMAKSAPGTFFEPLHAVMKTLAMIRSQDIAIIGKASGPTYDGTVAGVAGKWTGIMAKCKLALMAAGGGLAIGLSGDSFPIIVTILAVLAGGAYVWIYLRKLELEKSLIRARAEILPEVERAFVEGRYILPPMPQA